MIINPLKISEIDDFFLSQQHIIKDSITFVPNVKHLLTNQHYFKCSTNLFSIDSEYGRALIGFNIINKKLICIPHSSYGICWIEKPNKGKELLTALIKKLKESYSFEDWEIRTTFPLSDFIDKQKVLTYKRLDTFDIYWKGISSNLRRKIRKAEKSNFREEIGGIELLNTFYPIYNKHIQSLGSFALPKKYLETLLTDFDEEAFIILIKKENKIAGGALYIKNYDVMENLLFVPLRKYRNEYISDYIHHKMIEWTIEKDIPTYSFGRSTKNSSVFKYKQNWKVENQTLYWNTGKERRFNVRYFSLPKKIIPYIPTKIYNELCKIVANKIV